MNIIHFISSFSKIHWVFEFVLSHSFLSKALFCFKSNDSAKILDYLLKIEWLSSKDKIKTIFNLYWERINHIWIDENTQRYKFYISLYESSFEDSLLLINNVKNILWVTDKYFLERDFMKFDCIWFDVSKDWITYKIYELVDLNNNLDWLPIFIKKEDVKEVWYLKSPSGRKKKFFRFKNSQEIELFKEEFNLERVDELQKNIKNYHNLQKRVKYYCIEWEKKEIYFT